MPPDYGASIRSFPDGARRLDNHIKGLEEHYKISLEPLHRKVAPLIGRFQELHGNEPRKHPEPEDTSARLLAEVLASGVHVTFADVDRVSVRVHDAHWRDRKEGERERSRGNEAKVATVKQTRSDELPKE